METLQSVPELTITYCNGVWLKMNLTRQQEVILDHEKRLKFETPEFNEYLRVHNQPTKQHKDVIMAGIKTVDDLNTFIDMVNNNGLFPSSDLEKHKNLKALVRSRSNFSDEFISYLLNVSLKSDNGVTEGKSEILVNLCTIDVVRGGKGDYNTEELGKVEIKGNAGTLQGHGGLDVSETINGFDKELGVYRYGKKKQPIYHSATARKSIINSLLNKGVSFNDIITTFFNNYVKRYYKCPNISEEFLKKLAGNAKEFCLYHKEEIISEHIKTKGKNKGQIQRTINDKFITYTMMVIDVICYQMNDKWDLLMVLHCTYDGRYVLIKSDMMEKGFDELYSHLDEIGITWVTTGVNDTDPRQQAIKIKYE